jgi:hypothetical protein
MLSKSVGVFLDWSAAGVLDHRRVRELCQVTAVQVAITDAFHLGQSSRRGS